MSWGPRVRYAHAVDFLSTGTTSSTNLPTPQVKSSLSWGRAMVDQQVTMVHLARFPSRNYQTITNLEGNHISSDVQEEQQDSYAYIGVTHQLKATPTLHRPQTINLFPTLDGNHHLIPDPWRESDFVWWTRTTTTTRFGYLYRQSLRLHLLEQGWSQVATSIFAPNFIHRTFW